MSEGDYIFVFWLASCAVIFLVVTWCAYRENINKEKKNKNNIKMETCKYSSLFNTGKVICQRHKFSTSICTVFKDDPKAPRCQLFEPKKSGEDEKNMTNQETNCADCAYHQSQFSEETHEHDLPHMPICFHPEHSYRHVHTGLYHGKSCSSVSRGNCELFKPWKADKAPKDVVGMKGNLMEKQGFKNKTKEIYSMNKKTIWIIASTLIVAVVLIVIGRTEQANKLWKKLKATTAKR